MARSETLEVDVLTKEHCDNNDNVKKLKIGTIDNNIGNTARFANVKYLRVDPYCKNIDRLDLPKLESLSLYHANGISNDWSKFYRYEH